MINRTRSPLAPNVPAAAELGYPDLVFDGITGFFGWRDMSLELRQRIAADVRAVAAMVERGSAENEAVLAAWDFPQSGLVVDVGGGLGTLLAAVLRCRQGLRGTLFDVPHVVKRALPLFEAQGFARRWQSVAGNFFTDPLPAGADLYLLKKVIHDWDDRQAVAILQACARAMSPTSRLLLIEPVIAPGNDPSFAKMLDLFMLVWPGGRERTMPEHERIIAAAGLELRRSLVT